MLDGDRYERGRARFLEVHDEKAMRAVDGLGELGRHIVALAAGLSEEELREAIMLTASIAGFPPAMNATATLKSVLAECDRTDGATT